MRPSLSKCQIGFDLDLVSCFHTGPSVLLLFLISSRAVVLKRSRWLVGSYTGRLLTHCCQERKENIAELRKDVHSQGVHHLPCGCYGNSLVAESTLSTLPKKSLRHLYIPDENHGYYTVLMASFPVPHLHYCDKSHSQTACMRMRPSPCL